MGTRPSHLGCTPRMVGKCLKGSVANLLCLFSNTANEFGQWETIASWIYFVTATYIKLGFLFFYRRIFSPDATAKVLVNGGIVVSSLVGLGLFIGIVFFCLPIGKAWNNALSGHCANPVVLAWLSGAWNALVDIYVLILPIPFIWKLNMAPKRKRRLIAVFGVGIL